MSTREPRRAPALEPGSAIPALILAGLLVAAAAAQASSPRVFRAGTQADFLRGDVEHLSVDDRGQLLLGPAAEVIYETTTPFLWSVVQGTGGDLFVGSGNEGRVFRVDAKGAGTIFFDAPELEVHALAPAPDGGLFVGTSPDGRIYRVDRTGAATTFFEPGERYIWALAADSNGTLYAATGEKGVIYRITPDGSGAPFYQAAAVHVTALAVDGAGNLLAGTGSPGRVLRIDSNGRGFVLLDSPYREISTLRFDGGGLLYVAATNGPAQGQSPPSPVPAGDDASSGGGGTPGVVATVTAEVTSMAVVDSPSAAAAPPVDSRLPRGAIYRIPPDGLWDQIWESRDDAPYDLTLDQEGRLVVGTGSAGKIFRLEGEPARATLLSRAAAQQVTALLRDSGGRLYYATANPGKLFRLSAERTARGTYESEVRDARAVSTWGAISWRGSIPPGTSIEVFTRSGNTAVPDNTWSPWSAAHTNPDGTPITSPSARYLQWRAVLSGSAGTPVLTSITAAYLQRNLPPQVRSITVHPPGIVFQRPYSSGEPELAGVEDRALPERRLAVAAAQQGTSQSAPALGRRAYQRGLQTFVWRAEDENDDELTFDVYYRREGDQDWTPLRTLLVDPMFVWNTATVPNGTYFVKVVASDRPSNEPALSRTGEMVSPAFDVDNAAPVISEPVIRVEGASTVVVFEVTDDHSIVQRVEYSEDGQRWLSVFPVDGLADSRRERYEIRIDGRIDSAGLSIRAGDALNNWTSTHVPAPAGP